ncbi:MAG: hypothetical protein AAGA93_08645 [Actinomycetota bacterium]
MPVETAKPRVLCVVGDAERFAGLDAVLDARYQLEAVADADEALARLGQRVDVDAIIVDLATIGHDTDLLGELDDRSPAVARILLTDRADLGMATAAIDDTEVLTLLPWPCRPDDLLGAVDIALVETHGRRRAATLIDRNVHGTVDLLRDLVGRIDEEAVVRAQRIHDHVHRISLALGRPVSEELGLAASLSQLGNVVKPITGPDETPDVLDRRAEIGAELLIHVPGLEPVAALVRGHAGAEPIGVGTTIDDWSDRELDAEILRLAARFETLVGGEGRSPEQATTELAAAPTPPAAFLLAALEPFGSHYEAVELELQVAELQTGMVLTQQVLLTSGPCLAPVGMQLTSALIDRIADFARGPGVRLPIHVSMPTSRAASASR